MPAPAEPRKRAAKKSTSPAPTTPAEATTTERNTVADDSSKGGAEIALREQYPIMELATTGSLAEILEMNVGGSLTQFDLDRVGIPAGGGKYWAVPTLDGVEDLKELEGVIVHWRDTRAYWAKKYDGSKNPPDCSSKDNIVGEGLMGRGSEGNPSGLCADCPFSKFGTAVNDEGEQTNGQACKQVRILFLVRPGDNLPIVVGLPPTSVRPMHRFFLRLAGKAVPYDGIITKLALTQEKSGGGITYSQVVPSVGKVLPPEEQDAIRKYGNGIRLAVDSMIIDHQDLEATADVGPQRGNARDNAASAGMPTAPTATQAAQTSGANA